jgi:hypothetical protein
MSFYSSNFYAGWDFESGTNICAVVINLELAMFLTFVFELKSIQRRNQSTQI